MNIEHICIVFHLSEIKKGIAYNKQTFLKWVFRNTCKDVSNTPVFNKSKA